MAKLVDVDQLEEFQPVLTAQLRPIEARGKQWLPLCHVLGLLRAKCQAATRTAAEALSVTTPAVYNCDLQTVVRRLHP